MLTTAPEYLLWNYTYHCNLNCTHCYSRADTYPAEVDGDQALIIADNIGKANVFQVALGGGEVLYRRDVIEVIGALSRYGTFVSVTTNGWPISRSSAANLAQAGIGDVYVSIDSLDDDVHDEMRGQPGTLKRALNAVKICKEAGIRTKISAVLTKKTVESIDRIIEFADRSFVSEVNFKRFRASGNGYLNRNSLELPSEMGSEIEEKILKARKTSETIISLNFNPETNEVDSGCACGISSLTLRPNGDVALCSYSETVLGNLLENDLSAIWTESPVLRAKRGGFSCEALHGSPSPSKSAWIKQLAWPIT